MMGTTGITIIPGVCYFPQWLAAKEQETLYLQVKEAVKAAPLFQPRMPRTGKPFSVQMSNCGRFGWVADRQGYRYQTLHPDTNRPWPPIPLLALQIWKNLAHCDGLPQACLINFYPPEARMGLHQDRDEQALEAPVLSISLGQSALFRFGGTDKRNKTQSLVLNSGDILTFGGPARLMYHGVDRIMPSGHNPLSAPGRLNITLRRVYNV